MRFAKLPARALTTVREAVEEDAVFRARIAEQAEEAKLDRVPWLWLVRPRGWETELETLAPAAVEAVSGAEQEKEEQAARRPVGPARAAPADAELAQLRQVNADLTGELTAKEHARRQMEGDRDAIRLERQSAEEERARLREAVAALESRVSSLGTDLDEAAGELAQVSRERDGARDQIAQLTDQLEQARSEENRPHVDREPSEVARQSAEEERAGLQAAVAALESRVLSLGTDLDEAAAELTQVSQERDGARDEIEQLTRQLEQACDEVSRLQADRDAGEVARQSAEEERAGLQAAVAALESRVSSLGKELDKTAGQFTQVSQERDNARDQIALLTNELEEANAEVARLEAGRGEIRAAAGRGIARAAEAARLLSATLAEVALTGGGQAEVQGEESAPGDLHRAGELLPVPERPSGGERARERERMAGIERSADVEGPVDEPGRGGNREREGHWLAEVDRFAGPERPGRVAEAEDLVDERRRGLVDERRRSERTGEGERSPEVERLVDERPRGAKPAPQAKHHPPTTDEVSAVPARQSRAAIPRRRPVRHPSAVFYDSPEAADYLVSVPGILLIVDGRDVTMPSAAGFELSRQRYRLIDGLAELAIRTGTQVHAVFHGAELSGRFEPPGAARPRMRVTFVPDAVEPGHVIVELVDQLDAAQAVVLATGDRALQQEVLRRGGNVISMAQLLAVLRPALDKPASSRPRAASRRRRNQGLG
jgi:ParB family chromosome partitioning protein